MFVGTSRSGVVHLDILVKLCLKVWNCKPTECKTIWIREKLKTSVEQYTPVHEVTHVVPLVCDTNIQHIFKPLRLCISESSPRLFGFDVGVAAHEIVLQCPKQTQVQFLTYGCLSISDVVVLCPMVTLRQQWQA